ncbi:RNA-binding protein PIN4 [Nakaseomyces glabratus]|nr:RNA-binding protein PIN4 [Nakaseomyces glabratus]KTB25659.1 RNA-binding protein PIN4 [Nakaseomyces glabratus]
MKVQEEVDKSVGLLIPSNFRGDTTNASYDNDTEMMSDAEKTVTSAGNDLSNNTNTSNDDDDDIIPTAIVIKNIPFALKREQLLDFMTSLDLPLPYAFNYHFDNGTFRVISIESSINGNNSNPNSSPLDQHQNHLHSMPNSAGKCFAPLPTGVSPLANNVVLSSSSNNPLALDMNDPDTLEIYSQLLLFKDREHLYTELIYPSGIANSLRRILDLCCSALGLIESSDPNFITIRRKTNNYDFQKQLGESSGTMVDHGMIDQPLNSTSTGGESLSSSQSYTSLSNTRLSLSLVNSTNTSDYIPTMNQHGISKSTALFPQAVTNDSPNVRYANSASGQSGSSILHASSYMDPHNQTSTTSSGINISGFFNGRSSSISGQGMSSNYMLQRQRVPVPFFSNQNNSDLRVNGYNSQKSTKIGVMGAGQGLGPHLTNGSTVSAATNMTTNYGIIQGNELFNEYEQQPPISRGIW